MQATRKVVMAVGAAACCAVCVLWTVADPGRHASASQSRAEQAKPAVQAAISRVAPRTKKTAEYDDHAGSVEICGRGMVRLTADDPDGQQYVSALTERAADRWVADLRAGNDVRARAVAMELMRPKPSEALATLALQNDDPALYAIAASSCANVEPAGAMCAQISPLTLARSDADNAVPWLEAAWQMRRAGDVAGERAAMQHAAATHRVENYELSMLAYVNASLPTDLSAVERNHLQITIIGVEAATGVSGYVEASKYCSKEALNETAVAGQCRALTELLDSQGSSIVELMFAKTIGKRVGWSPERVQSAERYIDALMAEEARFDLSATAPRFSCPAVTISNAFLAEVANHGEVAALRSRVEQSGEDVGRLALEYRRSLATMMEQAARSAAADEQAAAGAH